MEERKGYKRREEGRAKERRRETTSDLQQQFRLAKCAQSGQSRKACHDISCPEHANIHIYINPNTQITLLPHQEKVHTARRTRPATYHTTLTPSCSPPLTSQHPHTTPRRPGYHHTNNKTPPPATDPKSIHMHFVTSWQALCHSANTAPSQPAGPREHACRGQRAGWFERSWVPLCRPGTRCGLGARR